MPSCAQCGTTILFGGVKFAGQTFCNARCANTAGGQLAVQQAIPPDVLAQRIAEIHDGPCPKCNQDRLVDLHPAHFVWSAVFLTRYTSKSELSCRGCARKRQAMHALGSFFLGWWGFPFGLIITPIQIGRNLFAMIKPENPNPSAELASVVQSMLGQQLLAAGWRPESNAPTKLTDATRGGATHSGATGRNTNQTPIDLVEPQQIDTRR